MRRRAQAQRSGVSSARRQTSSDGRRRQPSRTPGSGCCGRPAGRLPLRPRLPLAQTPALPQSQTGSLGTMRRRWLTVSQVVIRRPRQHPCLSGSTLAHGYLRQSSTTPTMCTSLSWLFTWLLFCQQDQQREQQWTAPLTATPSTWANRAPAAAMMRQRRWPHPCRRRSSLQHVRTPFIGRLWQPPQCLIRSRALLTSLQSARTLCTAKHNVESVELALVGEKLPSGHVRCPNCAKMLPQAFINSHLDSCLTGSKGSGGGIWGTGGSKGSTTPAAAQLNGVRSSGGGGGGYVPHSTANGLGSGSLAGRAAGSGSIWKQLKVCMCNVSARLLSDSQVCSDAHAVR